MLNSMNNYVANSLVLSMLQASGYCVEASGCRPLITMSKLKVACSKRDGSKPVIERKKMVKFNSTT